MSYQKCRGSYKRRGVYPRLILKLILNEVFIIFKFKIRIPFNSLAPSSLSWLILIIIKPSNSFLVSLLSWSSFLLLNQIQKWHLFIFIRILMQIGKAVLCFIHNPIFPADICKNFHKPVMMWTWKFIRIAISSDIPLLQSREISLFTNIFLLKYFYCFTIFAINFSL